MSPRSGISRSRGAASARSCPAQKPRPAPVSTTARIVLSPPACASASHRSRAIDRVKLLRTSGRLSVIVDTASALLERMSGICVPKILLPVVLGSRRGRVPNDRLQHVTTLPPPVPRGGRSKSASKTPKADDAPLPESRFEWRRIAYHALVSRALDDIEETTNKNRANVPREHLVLYQFSARGHEVAQAILGSLITHRHDGASAYYRSRPLLLSLGLGIDDAFASPLGRAGGFSVGRDIGVVCNLPNRDGPVVLPMSGDVGSQYTPCAGWAQSIRYHTETLKERDWDSAIAVVLGGEASVATNGFWSALTIATTLSLPMLFYIEDNDLGISVRGDMQTPGSNIARNLASFTNLLTRDGDGTNPEQSAALLAECVAHVRSGNGPALGRLTVPRLCSHSGPDNQRGYRTDAEINADAQRDPLPRLREFLVPSHLSDDDWAELESEVQRDVQAGLEAARARPNPDPASVARWVYA